MTIRSLKQGGFDMERLIPASFHRHGNVVLSAVWYMFFALTFLVFCGEAAADGFISLKSYNYQNHYVRHRNYLGEITTVSSPLDFDDSSFKMVKGLAGDNTVSFESKNYPGYYLRHQGFRIKLHRPDGSDLFRHDASFRVMQGMGNPSWSSFESVNYPGYFLRHRNFQLYIERGEGDLFRKDCTFKIVDGSDTQSGTQVNIQPAPGEYLSLRSYNYPNHYIRHRNYLGEITTISSQLDFDDSSFKMVKGLAGSKTVSFESKNYPGYYLRHQGFRIKLHRPDGSDLFRNDASFKVAHGLADSSWNSFESVNYPGYFLRHRNFQLYIERGEDDLFRKDCTFRVERTR